MSSLSANERLFLIDMDKVKKKVEDWNLLTTQSDMDKQKDQFFNLMGSAQAYLKTFPNKLKQVINSIDSYTSQWNTWATRGTSQSRVQERLLETVFPKIETLVGFSEVNIPALSAEREAILDQATDRAAALEDQLKTSEAKTGKAQAETLLEKAKGQKKMIVGGVVLLGIGLAAKMIKDRKKR